MSTETIQQVVQQEIIENQFNRKLINKKIKAFVVEHHQDFIEKGVDAINEYLNGSYYESKRIRLLQVKELNPHELVTKILVFTSYQQYDELFTSVSAQLAGVLGFSDKADSIKTMGELLAVVCATDAYDITKNQAGSLVLKSNIKFDKELTDAIEQSMYLPPMVVKPLELKSNKDTGYLTFQDTLLLGHGNHHNGDICLDALNTINSVQLKLDTDFISSVELTPTFEVTTPQQQEQWDSYKRMTYRIMLLLATTNNHFYLTHRVDKRGRIYAQGYNVTTQGHAYNKASIEFANEELIEVPVQHRL
jgi:hypothetical protein